MVLTADENICSCPRYTNVESVKPIPYSKLPHSSPNRSSTAKLLVPSGDDECRSIHSTVVLTIPTPYWRCIQSPPK